MLYGLDFGTSNSAISLLMDNGPVRVLPVDPGQKRPEIINSLIYFRRDGSFLVGRAASEAYYQDNVGREVVKELVNTGETYKSFISGFGEVTEKLVVAVDQNQPGRFFQSIKSFLPDEDYAGTEVFGTFMTLEAIVATYLKILKDRADQQVGQSVEGVVLGRPVIFGPGGTGDDLAQERLKSAAIMAGFKEVHFQFEPVAAALHYEQEISAKEEIVLVFDFGGGTLDTTLVKVRPGQKERGDRRKDILATNGRIIGGNTLDEEIMENKLFKHFGENTRWSEQGLAMPNYIFSMLRRWYTIPNLQEQKLYTFLNDISRFSKNRKPIKALECLIRKNYGFALFQEIERAKVELSEKWETRISFYQEVIAIDEFLSRGNFETIIAGALRKIETCLDETLAIAEIPSEQVKAVLRTGGSSYIPAVQRMLEKKFGRQSMRFQDAFSNVASGLGVAAARGTWND